MNEFQDRINIWNETKQIARRSYTDVSKSFKYDPANLRGTIRSYTPCETEIIVINMDTIDAVWYSMDKLGAKKPVLLNMANQSYPGGGVDMGCGAQEENIFRRSNYFLTLKFDPKFYPILDESVIYSRDVTMFRYGENRWYELMQVPRKVSIIASPSICRPELENGHFNEEDYELEYKKIDMIFKTALYHEHDTLIFSAYGCGAFACPPEDVSMIFKDIIKKYDGIFKYVIFAIIDNERTQNFSIFRKNLL